MLSKENEAPWSMELGVIGVGDVKMGLWGRVHHSHLKMLWGASLWTAAHQDPVGQCWPLQHGTFGSLVG